MDKTETMQQFRTFQKQLLDLMHQSQEVLNNTALTLREDSGNYKLPIERLEKSVFTLTLVGAFQSGKSTLFSYLCGGRELSPIGPAGGGIRTSGCRVAASAVSEIEEEYAIVSWRSKEDLLEPICSMLGLEAAEYKLDEKRCREEIEKLLLKDMKGTEMLNPDKLELYRMALIIVHFYERYSQRLSAGEERMSVDGAINIAAYPQEWWTMWERWEQQSASLDTVFRAEEVAFAFCGGIHYFIHSEHLGKLGCTVEDCPGLFASEWDTKIAKKCIADTNAILYVFEGQKDLTQNDIDILKTCIELGGRDRILFGANVKVPYMQWDRIQHQGVLPKLTKHGFVKPVVHAYHAAIALRCAELAMVQCNMLPESTCKAIEESIKLDGGNWSIEEYLSDQLDNFLRNALRKGLKDYSEEGRVLLADIEEEASKVPAFIRTAQDKITRDKAWSVLVGNGANKLSEQLDKAEKNATALLQKLDMSAEELRADLEEQERKIQNFDVDVERCTRTLKDATEKGIDGIKARFNKLVSDIYIKRRGDVITLTEEAIPIVKKCIQVALGGEETWWEKIKNFSDKVKEVRRQSRKTYESALRDTLKDLVIEVRDYYLRDKFTQWDEFAEIKSSFDYWKGKMMEQVKQLQGMPELDDERLRLGEHFGEQQLNDMQIQGVTVETIDGDLPWLTTPFGNQRDQATDFVKKYDDKFTKAMQHSLWEVMESHGPIKAIRDYLKDFEDTFEQPRKIFDQQKATTLKNLEDTSQRREELRGQLEPLIAKLSQLRESSKKFGDSVAEVFERV